jgi:hypothetical protein
MRRGGVNRVKALRRVFPEVPTIIAVELMIAAAIHESAVVAPVPGVKRAVKVVVVSVDIINLGIVVVVTTCRRTPSVTAPRRRRGRMQK